MEQREILNAIITGTTLDIGDRGFLQGWIFIDHERGSQGFGGYVLYLPKSFSHHKLESLAGHFIQRTLEVAGADKWENLKGKTIRVNFSHSKIEGIGHIVKDDWFYPGVDFKEIE